MTENKDWTGDKNSVFKALGASNHSESERQNEDFYATDPKAAELLLKLEIFSENIWEPACGQGHLSKIFEKAGYKVKSSDLINREYGETGVDFLAIDNLEFNGDIITNPPFKYAQEFIEKALQIIPVGNKVAMFLKVQFLEGKGRKSLFINTPPIQFIFPVLGYFVLRMGSLKIVMVVRLLMRGTCGKRALKALHN